VCMRARGLAVKKIDKLIEFFKNVIGRALNNTCKYCTCIKQKSQRCFL